MAAEAATVAGRLSAARDSGILGKHILQRRYRALYASVTSSFSAVIERCTLQ